MTSWETAIVDSELHQINSHPLAKQLAAPLLVWAARVTEPQSYLEIAVAEIQREARCEWVGVMRAERGQWQSLARAGRTGGVPERLLSETLDRETASVDLPWSAAPLSGGGPPTDILVLRNDSLSGEELVNLVDSLAALLATAAALVDRHRVSGQRIARMEAILRIAGQWNQIHQMEELLQQMAEAATQLFDAERASIFLWDRRNHVLVGRPALGVDAGELRIPDDKGIVGQVVQTGQPRLVQETSELDQQEVDRSVDRQLGFQTRSLLCVPLCGRERQRLGAFELINKRDSHFTTEDQVGLEELARHAAIALENSLNYKQLLSSRRQIVDQAAQEVQLVGDSPPMEALRMKIRRVADTDLAILLLGENGTGKEIASRMVHYLSSRRNEPFIAVNCAALTESLLESELFGHERGAFTDAHEARAGRFELASGGTLFLDEVADLSPGGQAKLLRVLEEKVVVRVGGSIPIATDVRVIAATNQDLVDRVRNGGFRQDLFFRLNVVTLNIPPLRERGEDILQIAEHFLQVFCVRARRPAPTLSARARKTLLQYPWPGNVRELRNLMERLAYLTQSDTIGVDDLAFVQPPDSMPDRVSMNQPLHDATRQFQIEYIQRHIESSDGNMTDAARRLGLHRSNLYRKMRQLGMTSAPDEATE